jgi:transcription elongation factor Elf1
MQPFEPIQCPFCGQTFDVPIETNDQSQRLVIDCEICCRPLEISVECQAGEILSVDVRAN